MFYGFSMFEDFIIRNVLRPNKIQHPNKILIDISTIHIASVASLAKLQSCLSILASASVLSCLSVIASALQCLQCPTPCSRRR